MFVLTRVSSKIKYYIFVLMQLLRNLAWPISLIYGAIVYLRNWLYDKGYFKSNSFSTTTLCIGNLSVGGTGKTPMIEWVLKQISDKNEVVVLSRGYKRRTKGFLLANTSSTAEDIGDEPLQIFSKFPEVAVAVDEDRVNGIKRIEELLKPQLILLDDAYQHRKVEPSVSVLLTSYGNLYIDDNYLPTGNLRDSKSASKRADLIIVTKCPSDLDAKTINSIENSLNTSKHQKILFCTLSYDSIIQNEIGNMPLELLRNKEVTLVTGIANPTPLLDYLTSKEISFEHLPYRDHHFFTAKELALFNGKDLVVTTEKDFMRLKGKVANLYYLGVQHRFIGDGANSFRELLLSLRN